jgi:hypothetical protein
MMRVKVLELGRLSLIFGSIFLLAAAMPVHGGSDGECLDFEKFFSGPVDEKGKSSWSVIHEYYERYVKLTPNCDDGVVGEGYSEMVSHTFAKKWNELPSFLDLGKKDKGFHTFALSHVDSTAEDDDLKAIIRNAIEQCPKEDRNVCLELKTRAQEALGNSMEYGEPEKAKGENK